MIYLHLAILRSAALLVHVEQRGEWFAEWSAELRYVTHGATVFCLGAFQDAIWLRRNNPAPNARRTSGLDSPLRCVLLLAILAAVSVFLALRLPLAAEERAARRLFPAYLFMIVVSVPVLSATTSLALGEYPGKNHFRRWIFFATKIALILPIVYCGSLDVAATVARAFQPHGFLVGLIVGLRWALVDQRRRCPVCLRPLTNPTRIGGPSRTFLEWYGTELICVYGHGLLYVPEIPSSCYTTQRWQCLDPSWSSLFS